MSQQNTSIDITTFVSGICGGYCGLATTHLFGVPLIANGCITVLGFSIDQSKQSQSFWSTFLVASMVASGSDLIGRNDMANRIRFEGGIIPKKVLNSIPHTDTDLFLDYLFKGVRSRNK